MAQDTSTAAAPDVATEENFLRELAGMTKRDILRARDSGKWGRYDPTNSANSDWKVKLANRKLTEEKEDRHLAPARQAVWISAAALVVSILALAVSIKSSPQQAATDQSRAVASAPTK